MFFDEVRHQTSIQLVDYYPRLSPNCILQLTTYYYRDLSLALRDLLNRSCVCGVVIVCRRPEEPSGSITCNSLGLIPPRLHPFGMLSEHPPASICRR